MRFAGSDSIVVLNVLQRLGKIRQLFVWEVVHYPDHRKA
jgi:hypothetical protein